MMVCRVGILTAGGLAPCLSASVGALIEAYSQLAPTVEIRCYCHGYAGLLRGDSFLVTPTMRGHIDRLFYFGGSAIGNSRVKLSNVADCIKRGFVGEGKVPQVVAAEQLARDGIDVLHSIGGDDTSAVAAQLASYLKEIGCAMAVVGLPKTIDNDIFPLTQTLGAATAAEESAKFFRNVVNECTTAPRMLIVHEVMGRNCGWLTASAAMRYRRWLDEQKFLADIGLDRRRWEIHGVYIPEKKFELASEIDRLRGVMDKTGNVNIFLSEGAVIETILREMEREGQSVSRDAFGHIKLDFINSGKWLGERLLREIGAEKLLVQKSGYFARSAAPNDEDLQLIRATAKMAVQHALKKESGLVGCDEERNGKLSLVDFARVRGGKPYNCDNREFVQLLQVIGQE